MRNFRIAGRRLSARAMVIGTAAVLALPLVGAAADAAATGSGTVNGCYLKTTGTLRVIHPGAAGTRGHCLSTETPISWNQAGPQGVQGPKGDPGQQGLQGLPGEKGDQGLQGLPGDKGDKGDQGIQGIQGLPGQKGDKGDKGDQGIQGIQGEQGYQGLPGSPGITAYQVVTGATTLSLTEGYTTTGGATAQCPPGTHLLGGGSWSSADVVGIASDGPVLSGSGNPTDAWGVRALVRGDGTAGLSSVTVKAFAYCAVVGS